ILDFQAAEIDAALRDPELQYLEHLLQLELRGRGHDHRGVLELEARVRSLEIEALPQLAQGLIDRIGQLVLVDLGDHVEGRHQDSLSSASSVERTSRTSSS